MGGDRWAGSFVREIGWPEHAQATDDEITPIAGKEKPVNRPGKHFSIDTSPTSGSPVKFTISKNNFLERIAHGDYLYDDHNSDLTFNFLAWPLGLENTFEAAKRYFTEHLAQEFDLPPESAAARVADLIATVQAEVAQRNKPSRLIWGKDSKPDENPAVFAWRAYAAEAKAETLHLGVIRQEDEPLAIKLYSWLRSPANQKFIPEGFDIPTKPEWITRQLAKRDAPLTSSATYAATEEARLYSVAKRRAQRLRQLEHTPNT